MTSAVVAWRCSLPAGDTATSFRPDSLGRPSRLEAIKGREDGCLYFSTAELPRSPTARRLLSAVTTLHGGCILPTPPAADADQWRFRF